MPHNDYQTVSQYKIIQSKLQIEYNLCAVFHVLSELLYIECVDFIDERYLYAADFTEKEKTYLMKISKLKQR